MLGHFWLKEYLIRGCQIWVIWAAICLGQALQSVEAKPQPVTTEANRNQQNTFAPSGQTAQTERPAYKFDCSNPKNVGEADLCEQRRMANAAENTLFWIRWQTWVGFLGIAGLVTSILYTRKAAVGAIKAAKAAEDTVRVARDHAHI